MNGLPPATQPADEKTRHPWLVYPFLVAVYTHVTVRLGPGLAWPAGAAVFFGAAMLALNLRRVQRGDIAALYLLMVFPLLHLPFAYQGLATEFLFDRFKAWVMFSTSIAIGYAFFLEMLNWGARRTERLMFAVMCIIVLGCLLELTTPLRTVTEAFQARVFSVGYQDSTFSEGRREGEESRDVAKHGGVRPKFFTSEPSHVARWYLLFSMLWFLVTQHPRRNLIYFTMTIAAFAIIRSPFVALALLTPGLANLLPRKITNDGRFIFSYGRLATAAGLLIACPFVGYVATMIILPDRLATMVTDQDGSLFQRLIGPARVTWETLGTYPLCGAGIDGLVAILSIVGKIYASTDFKMAQISLIHAVDSIFFRHWIYFGLLGGTMLAGLLANVSYRLTTGLILVPMVLIAIMSTTAGSYTSPRIWFMAFAILLVIRLNMESLRDQRSANDLSSAAIPNENAGEHD